jgi:hypothetical protein
MTSTPLTRRDSSADSSHARAGWRPLVRHYVEMVLAMTAGMLVLGTVRDLLGLTVPFAERPALSYLLMATDMAIGMAAWMRFRGHGWAGTLEMCAAMYVPAVLVPLVWVDVMDEMTFMVAAHTLMLLAMLAVLLRRSREFAHGTHR